MGSVCFIISIMLLLVAGQLFARGTPHQPRSEEGSALAEAVDVQETGVPVNRKSNDRNWGVEATTGWDRRHVQYGVDESGPSGNYVNGWNSFGLGHDLVASDFTGAYNLVLGPVCRMWSACNPTRCSGSRPLPASTTASRSKRCRPSGRRMSSGSTWA